MAGWRGGLAGLSVGLMLAGAALASSAWGRDFADAFYDLGRIVQAMQARRDTFHAPFEPVYDAYEGVADVAALRSALTQAHNRYLTAEAAMKPIREQLELVRSPYLDSATTGDMAAWHADNAGSRPGLADFEELMAYVARDMAEIADPQKQRQTADILTGLMPDYERRFQEVETKARAYARRMPTFDVEAARRALEARFPERAEIRRARARAETRLKQVRFALWLPNLDPAEKATIRRQAEGLDATIAELDAAAERIEDVMYGRTRQSEGQTIASYEAARAATSRLAADALEDAYAAANTSRSLLVGLRDSHGLEDARTIRNRSLVIFNRLKNLSETVIPKEIEKTQAELRRVRKMTMATQTNRLNLLTNAAPYDGPVEPRVSDYVEETFNRENSLRARQEALEARLEKLQNTGVYAVPSEITAWNYIQGTKVYANAREELIDLGIDPGMEIAYSDSWAAETRFNFEILDIDREPDRNPIVPVTDPVFAVDENAADVTLGRFVAVDPDGDPLSLSLAGDAAQSFAIDSASGAITILEPLDFEATPQIGLEIGLSQGDYAKTFPLTVHVNDLAEEPLGLYVGALGTMEEHLGEGYAFAEAGTSRFEGVTITIEGEDAANVRYNATFGFLETAEDLDHERDSNLDFTVVARDADNVSERETLSITITDMGFDYTDLGDWDDPAPETWKHPNGHEFVGLNGPSGPDTMWYDAAASGHGPDVSGTYRGEVIHRFTRTEGAASEGGFGSVALDVTVGSGGAGTVTGEMQLRDQAGSLLHQHEPVTVDATYFSSGGILGHLGGAASSGQLSGTFAGDDAEEISAGFAAAGDAEADFHRSAGVIAAKRRSP